MLTRSYFTSDEAYDAYLLECDVLIKYRKEARSVPALRTSLRMEEKVREDYVGIVLSLQEKNNELQAKMEKREEKLWNIVRSMDQAVSDLYDLL
jgi:hypothetical protein